MESSRVRRGFFFSSVVCLYGLAFFFFFLHAFWLTGSLLFIHKHYGILLAFRPGAAHRSDSDDFLEEHVEAIAGLCTHPSRGCTSGGCARGQERRREPWEPRQWCLSLGGYPWELVPFSASILFGASSFQRLNSPSLRKEKNHWVLALDFESKLLFNTKWQKEVRAVVPDRGDKETGEAAVGAGALPRRQALGRDPLRSVPGAALPPLPRPPHRRAPPAPLASLRTKPAAEGRRGQLPGSSLGHPLSPAIAEPTEQR